LEEISGCNGLCAENSVVKSSNCGCGRWNSVYVIQFSSLLNLR
jgi:hypothetical protein